MNTCHLARRALALAAAFSLPMAILAADSTSGTGNRPHVETGEYGGCELPIRQWIRIADQADAVKKGLEARYVTASDQVRQAVQRTLEPLREQLGAKYQEVFDEAVRVAVDTLTAELAKQPARMIEEANRLAALADERIRSQTAKLLITGCYYYYEGERDPSRTGWRLSRPTLAGTKQLELTSDVSLALPVTINLQPMGVGASPSITLHADLKAGIKVVLSPGESIGPIPQNRPTTSVGGQPALEVAFALEFGGGLGVEVRVAASEVHEFPLPRLAGTLRAGEGW